jgi:hypothetical protein
MSGRRGHRRLAIGGQTSGAVRVLRDAVIERVEHQELVALSQTPAAVGDEMFMELFSGHGCLALQVRVLDSCPVVIAGSVRHRLRVRVTRASALETESKRNPLADSSTTPEVA